MAWAGRVVRAVAQVCCGVAALPPCGSIAAAMAALDFYGPAAGSSGSAAAGAAGAAGEAGEVEHSVWVDVAPGYYAGDVDTVIARSVTLSCPLCLAAAAAAGRPAAGAGAGDGGPHVADVGVVTSCRHGGGNGPFFGEAAALATGTDTCDEATLLAEAEGCRPGYQLVDQDLNPGPSVARLCVRYASRRGAPRGAAVRRRARR